MPAGSTHRRRSSRLGHLIVGLSSADRLRRYMARTGMTLAGQKLWTDTEIDLLRRFYPTYQHAWAALPGRSRRAVQSKAFRLRITRSLRVWSDDDLKRLKGPYRGGMTMREIQSLLPCKTARQIRGRAAHSGWGRPRKPPEATGLTADDSVRARAFAYGLTLRDLADLSGTRSYFLRKPSRTNWKNIGKAVELLEGSMSIVWNGR